MKLSELIKEAQDALGRYGDLDVLTEDSNIGRLTHIRLQHILPSTLDIDGIIFENPAYIEVMYDN